MQKQEVVLAQDKEPTRVVIIPSKSGHHQHTIIWIHGLDQTPQKYLHLFDHPIFKDFKIIAPAAPRRKVTASTTGSSFSSWFDIKFRNQNSFIIPINRAFSPEEIIDSFENILQPLIIGAREELNNANPHGKLIIAGFSQGCSMSLHSFFYCKDKIDAVVGISGYLFPITPYWPTDRYYHILYGKQDKLRPWEYVKYTYYGKIGMESITMVPNTGHEINQAMAHEFHKQIQHILHMKIRVITLNSQENHQHSLIWIHGLNQSGEKYLHLFQHPIFKNFRIIAPDAPMRDVTVQDKKCRSWFDIKFRNENSYKVPFDQAFSYAQVIDSFENIIKPLIHQAREQLDKVNPNGKLIVAGFSQGCGMALHSFYTQKEKINAVVGISGYLFPFTPLEKTDRCLRIIYGRDDKLRPWEYVKITYEGKIDMDKISLVQNTGHEINYQVSEEFVRQVEKILKL